VTEARVVAGNAAGFHTAVLASYTNSLAVEVEGHRAGTTASIVTATLADAHPSLTVAVKR
jgi:hypothetical protein